MWSVFCNYNLRYLCSVIAFTPLQYILQHWASNSLYFGLIVGSLEAKQLKSDI